MTRIATLFLLAAGCVTLIMGQASPTKKAGIAMAPQIEAGEGASAPCSLATLHGSYGYSFTGTLATASLAGQGTIAFSGKGELSGSYIENVGGVVFHGNFTGSITVNPDCTGAGTLTGLSHTWTVQMHLVVVDGGKQVMLLDTDPLGVISGTAKRQ